MSFPTLQEGDRLFSTDPAHPLIQLHDLIEDVAAVAAFPRAYTKRPRPTPDQNVQRLFFFRNLQERVDELVENFIPISDVPVDQNGRLAIANTDWSKQDARYTAEQARFEAGLPNGEYRRATLAYDYFLPGPGGSIQRGDILGPWLYEDMFNVLSLCRYKKIETAYIGDYTGFIGDRRPGVPSGQDACAFAYSFADDNMSVNSDSFTRGIQVRNLAQAFSQVTIRGFFSTPSGGLGIDRLNINASSYVNRIAPFSVIGSSEISGYQQGLPETVFASATVYGWGQKRTESFETDRSIYTVYPVVPTGYPDYTTNTWVEWTSSNDLYRESGLDFEFPVSKYAPQVGTFSLNYAGNPCPRMTGTRFNPIQNEVAADYRVGERPIEGADNVRPFAIMEAQYTPPPEPDAYTYDLDIPQIDPEEPILA